MKKYKVVLTGGPCAGKTTAMQDIEREFKEKGFNVIIVPEAATILINMGIKPFGDNSLSMYGFQKYVMGLQFELESHADKCADEVGKDTIILCDRGLFDDKAYVSLEEYRKLIQEFGFTESDLLERYDLVIHLRTAALGASEFYTLSNNSARTESISEAIEKDEKTLSSWMGFRNLKIVGNDSDFKNKIKKCINEVYELVSKPHPIQRQNKYLVSNINFDELLKRNPVIFDIEQYIVSNYDKEQIYRKTVLEGDIRYNLITKMDTNINNERIVISRKIDDKMYDTSKNSILIKKKRYCFEYNNEYYRLDVFDDFNILEVESTKNSNEIRLPNFMKYDKEISNDEYYRNSNIYKRLNNE